MASDDPPDPFMEEVLANALAPYEGLVPPEVLATMRHLLEDALTTDRLGAELYARAKPRPIPLESGAVDKSGNPVEPAELKGEKAS